MINQLIKQGFKKVKGTSLCRKDLKEPGVYLLVHVETLATWIEYATPDNSDSVESVGLGEISLSGLMAIAAIINHDTNWVMMTQENLDTLQGKFPKTD